jgi:exonuclease III
MVVSEDRRKMEWLPSMRIMTWNIHGAKKSSSAWDFVLDLQPDIALLQEVGSSPEQFTKEFDGVCRPAIFKNGKPQRFCTGVFVKGMILKEITLSSSHEWINHELDFFKGNLVSCRVQSINRLPITVVSVYSPAWPINADSLEGVDVSQISTKMSGAVWCADTLWAGLQKAITDSETWVVGGDFNSSETFDVEWQAKNNRVFGIRSSGNAKMLQRMRDLGLTECLRQYNGGTIIPTFRHSKGEIEHQIDHLFVSNGFYSRLEKCTVGDQAIIFGKSLSDHLPIIADFRASQS